MVFPRKSYVYNPTCRYHNYVNIHHISVSGKSGDFEQRKCGDEEEIERCVHEIKFETSAIIEAQDMKIGLDCTPIATGLQRYHTNGMISSIWAYTILSYCTSYDYDNGTKFVHYF